MKNKKKKEGNTKKNVTKSISIPKVKYKIGDEITLKLSKQDGIITGIVVKESYKEYEVTYYCNEYRRAMVSQYEIIKGHSNEKPQTIGFRSEAK